jgi:glycosyltransferase involved in cell wall biosynthesis
MCQITAVIPTFNRGQLVQRAIESALNQTFRASQIVVVDDGSTDDTAEVCRKYSGSIEYVRQPNSGVSKARNHGVRLARHPWTAFLDSDDYWTPTHLEKIRDAIRETSGQACFYFTDLRFSTDAEDRTVWSKIGFSFSAPFFLAEDGTDWMLSQRQPCCLPCSVFNTDTFRLCGGFDPRFRVMEDTELFFRLGINGAVCAVNGVGCVATADAKTENRLTGTIHGHTASYWEHECMLWTRLLSRFPDLNVSNQRILRYCLATAYWRLTRVHLRAGQIGRSVLSVMRTAKAQPAFVLWLMRYGKSHGWERRVFPECRTT